MSNAYYRIYLKQVFDLAKTVVVKSELAIDAINRELRLFGHYVADDPRTWKYYMNLAGQYHQTDTLMTVTSMDTLETIDFTQENLQIHRATAEAYAYGSRYYRDLLERYPNQEQLILGILNPIDLEKAIAAEDGDVLYYDKTLVEPQELSLIPKLQAWIKAFNLRWNVAGYSITDELYAAGQLGVMFSQMVLEIINLRLENCLTNEAHSFHIRERLASHNRLDAYLPYLTLKQALFLYRNIKYLQRHSGTQKTFDRLLQRIINERDLPLARYDVLHRTTDMVDTLRPEVEMRRVPLNDHPGDGSSNRRTVTDVSERQFAKARNNQKEHFDRRAHVEERLENARNARLPTKILESALLDTTDSVTYSREDTIFNHWIYLVCSNRFNAVINVTNPKTGAASPMSVRDAFIVFLYAYNKSRGVTFLRIPPIRARRVRRPILPSVADMRAVVATQKVNDVALAKLREGQPAMGTYISVKAFRDFATEVYRAQNRQRNQYSQFEDRTARAMAESASALMYRDVLCDIGDSQYYSDWFAARGMDTESLSDLELDLLANDILTQILGEDITGTSFLAELQKNMLELMERLSSYTVQYLQSINNASYRVLDTVMPRFGDLDSRYLIHEQLDIHRIDPMNHLVKVKHLETAMRDSTTVLGLSSSKGEGYAKIDLASEVTVIHNPTVHYNVPIGSFSVTPTSDVGY